MKLNVQVELVVFQKNRNEFDIKGEKVFGHNLLCSMGSEGGLLKCTEEVYESIKACDLMQPCRVSIAVDTDGKEKAKVTSFSPLVLNKEDNTSDLPFGDKTPEPPKAESKADSKAQTK